MEEKRRIRLQAREARRALSADERAAASRALVERVLAMPGVRKVASVLGYVATAEEIDPAPLLNALRRAGVRVALPRVDAPARLALHWVAPTDALEEGAFGILEPAVDTPSAEPSDIDLVLVPGVAFDPGCNRVGYGGCFYDNLLPLLRQDALKIGLAFDVQLVASVPAEEHDVRLDAIVTPTATYVVE